MNIFPPLQVDFYKPNHAIMYPEGTTKIYSNLTPRKSRIKDINSVVVFGIQYFVIEYLMTQWNNLFFNQPKEVVVGKYKRMMDNTLGKDVVSTKHLEELWEVGYLPLHIKALPEGTLCPIGVPCLTITNTVDSAFWLVNYLETIMSTIVWQPMTSATIAFEYRKLLDKYAKETTGNTDGVQWQGHDFSMRGMSSLESACTSGAGHLLSFTGTDTIPAISFLEQFYGANVEKELVGASVPATEHSVMCMGTKDDEFGTFERLIDMAHANKWPIISIVSDTWDLWKVCTEYLPRLKDKIINGPTKIVIRPDSGDPVDIICGYPLWKNYDEYLKDINQEIEDKVRDTPPSTINEFKGVIELLWDAFGGTVNELGYKVLDPHIGAIYGDSITLERAKQICERLKSKGFASTNVVLGIGSYTYQYNTRDVFGFAVKATYGEVMVSYPNSENPAAQIPLLEAREIFKDPITDDGTKKSKKGLLHVYEGMNGLVCADKVSKEIEQGGLLETVFLNGALMRFQTLSEIRERLSKQK